MPRTAKNARYTVRANATSARMAMVSTLLTLHATVRVNIFVFLITVVLLCVMFDANLGML